MDTELTVEAKERILHALEFVHEQAELVCTLCNAIELHIFAASWPYSYCSDTLLDLTADPRLDRGTALLIYWSLGPYRYYHKLFFNQPLQDYEVEEFAFVKDIEARYTSGFYVHQNISYDPSEGTFFEVHHVLVPPEMHGKTPGIEINLNLRSECTWMKFDNDFLSE